MNTPNRAFPARNGCRDVPGSNVPTSFVKASANENNCRNGTYSPNGTRWILSYLPTTSPFGFTSIAELCTASRRGPTVVDPDIMGSSTPTAPTTIQALAFCAISLNDRTSIGSLVTNGAGDSSHTTNPARSPETVGAVLRSPNSRKFRS